MPTTTFNRLALAAAAAAFTLAALPAQATPYSKFYSFGDSLSDNGNVFALTGQPPVPYFNGRWSNGLVAVEYIANSFGLALDNYAYGGATTGLLNVSAGINGIKNTGVLAQVTEFATKYGGVADSNGLYWVAAGGNDFLSAPPGADLNAVAATAVGNLTNSVMALYAMGARNFVLPTMANLGATVQALKINQIQPGFAAGSTALSLGFNAALLGAYAQVATALPSEKLFLIDTILWQTSAMSQVVLNGGTATQSCVDNAAFPACTGYFYFDDIHPTTATHRSYANFVSVQVPEPASWGLAAVALLGVGLAGRRRKAAAQG